MTFLPYFPDDDYLFSVKWDLSGLPDGCSGIWTFAENSGQSELGGGGLAETFYYCGQIDGVRNKNCGFYWFKDNRFPGRDVGRFVMELYEKMADFFQDSGEPYRVFSRKLPLELTGPNRQGGVALTRSFMHVYPKETPPGADRLKFLFPHEMVHNWLKLDDEPFGTCTWYVEGTAEFYCLVLPDRYGMITREELLEQLNQRCSQYYRNPYREMKAADVGAGPFFKSRCDQSSLWPGTVFSDDG